MPMIDVYAAAGKFSDKHKLAQDLANAVMKWEKVPPIDFFSANTAAFVHELPPDALSNARGDTNYYGSWCSRRSAFSIARRSWEWSRR